MKKPKVNVLFFQRAGVNARRAMFKARTGCRPQNKEGMQSGCVEIHVTGQSYGFVIFWSDIIAASGVGANPSASLLMALKWAMGTYVRAFDTCQECRNKR